MLKHKALKMKPVTRQYWHIWQQCVWCIVLLFLVACAPLSFQGSLSETPVTAPTIAPIFRRQTALPAPSVELPPGIIVDAGGQGGYDTASEPAALGHPSSSDGGSGSVVGNETRSSVAQGEASSQGQTRPVPSARSDGANGHNSDARGKPAQASAGLEVSSSLPATGQSASQSGHRTGNAAVSPSDGSAGNTAHDSTGVGETSSPAPSSASVSWDASDGVRGWHAANPVNATTGDAALVAASEGTVAPDKLPLPGQPALLAIPVESGGMLPHAVVLPTPDDPESPKQTWHSTSMLAVTTPYPIATPSPVRVPTPTPSPTQTPLSGDAPGSMGLSIAFHIWSLPLVLAGPPGGYLAVSWKRRRIQV